MEPIVVLSLFDGISCGQLALQRAGIPVSVYYASEIDKKAMAVTTKNFPNTVHLGDVKNWKSWDFSEFGPPDLIMGGSPCQGFSHSGKGLNFKDPRSKLFFVFVDIINHFNPKYFLLENVGMKPAWEDIISKHMGVEPIKIDSALVSAAHRRRNYWTNIPGVSAPADKNINLSSIFSPYSARFNHKGVLWNAGYIVGRKLNAQGKREDYNKNLKYTQCFQVRKQQKKFNCLTTVQKDTVLIALDPGRYSDAFTKYTKDVDWRYLSAEEVEKLMTLPPGYSSVKINNSFIAESSRHKMCGNAWTVDVISHIFDSIVNSTHTWNGTKWVLNTHSDLGDEFKEFIKKSREEESKKNRNEKEAVIDQQLRELMGADK